MMRRHARGTSGKLARGARGSPHGIIWLPTTRKIQSSERPQQQTITRAIAGAPSPARDHSFSLEVLKPNIFLPRPIPAHTPIATPTQTNFSSGHFARLCTTSDDENWGAKGEGEGGETRKERRRRRRKERAAKVTAEGSGATGGADGDVKKDGEKKGRSEREKERKKERRREKRRQEKVDREAAKAAGLPAQPSKDQRGGRDRKRDRKKNKEDGGGAAGATAAAAPVASSNATATPAKSGSGQGTSATPGKVVGTWRPKIKKRDA